MDKSFDLTPLVDSLSNSFARRLGLNRRGFIHLLQACHFEEGDAAISGPPHPVRPAAGALPAGSGSALPGAGGGLAPFLL